MMMQNFIFVQLQLRARNCDLPVGGDFCDPTSIGKLGDSGHPNLLSYLISNPVSTHAEHESLEIVTFYASPFPTRNFTNIIGFD